MLCGQSVTSNFKELCYSCKRQCSFILPILCYQGYTKRPPLSPNKIKWKESSHSHLLTISSNLSVRKKLLQLCITIHNRCWSGTSVLQCNLCILMKFFHLFLATKRWFLLDTNGATLIALLKSMAKIWPWLLSCIFKINNKDNEEIWGVTIKCYTFSIGYKGISRLGSAFIFLRWFKLAHICIKVTSLHKWKKQGINHNFLIENQFHVTLRIVRDLRKLALLLLMPLLSMDTK